MDKKSFFSQMFTPGTVPCAVFGAALGLVFAVLCMTIGVVKSLLIGVFCLIGVFIGGVRDKVGFVKKILLFFHKDDSQVY